MMLPGDRKGRPYADDETIPSGTLWRFDYHSTVHALTAAARRQIPIYRETPEGVGWIPAPFVFGNCHGNPGKGEIAKIGIDRFAGFIV